MRIAHLSFSRVPSRKANAVQVMRLCEAFAGLGHEVTLYASLGDEAAGDPFAYYGVARRFELVQQRRPGLDGLGGMVYGWRVGRAVRARPLPDLFYGRDIYSLAAVASLGRPLIFEAHTVPSGLVGRTLQARLFRRSNFKHLVVISHALARDYLRVFPWLASQRVIVSPLGVAEPPAADGTQRWKGRLGREGHLRAGYIGQLYRGKGMELILELARLLPEVEFHVAGGTESLIASWRAAAGSLKNLHLHGHLPPAQTEPFRQAMDVLLAPYQESSRTENGKTDIAAWMSPLKVFEYMASHKPIIASNLPVLREILLDGVNALLVPPADAPRWAAAVDTLAQDARLRGRLADRARQDAVTRYGLPQRARAVLNGSGA